MGFHDNLNIFLDHSVVFFLSWDCIVNFPKTYLSFPFSTNFGLQQFGYKHSVLFVAVLAVIAVVIVVVVDDTVGGVAVL